MHFAKWFEHDRLEYVIKLRKEGILKGELLVLRQYGFSEALLEEIFLRNLNPVNVLFFRELNNNAELMNKFTKKDFELMVSYDAYLEFKKRFLLSNFSKLCSDPIKINKVFFKYDHNNINRYFTYKNQPLFLYGSGDITLLNREKHRIAIIGTRKPQKTTCELTEECTSFLVETDEIIVSGLAEGVDTIAHTAAIKNGGNTIAVLPTNFKKIYPKFNETLAYQISNEGLLLSAVGPEENTYKSAFLDRNMYIAAISDIVVVMETNLNSGTMNTIRNASNLNKKIFYFNQEDSAINGKLNALGGKCIKNAKQILSCYE